MGKQIKIDGKTSDWYESATFVMKDHVGQGNIPRDLVLYADELLERRLKLGMIPEASKSLPPHTSWIDRCFWGSLGLLGIVATLYFVF